MEPMTDKEIILALQCAIEWVRGAQRDLREATAHLKALVEVTDDMNAPTPEPIQVRK